MAQHRQCELSGRYGENGVQGRSGCSQGWKSTCQQGDEVVGGRCSGGSEKEESGFAFRGLKQGMTDDLLKACRQAKRDAKREVAKAKAKRYEDMYERLDIKEGEKKCTS